MIGKASLAFASFVTALLIDINNHTSLSATPLIIAAPIIPVESSLLSALPSKRDRDCIARVIYHEARGESVSGMIAVGMTVINRKNDGRFPTDICSVVYQRTKRTCQYTWVCDKAIMKKHVNLQQWNLSEHIAERILTTNLADPSKGATHFHNKTVSRFSRHYIKTKSIDNHIFYHIGG